MAELDLEQKDALSQIASRMCAWSEVVLLAGYKDCDRTAA